VLPAFDTAEGLPNSQFLIYKPKNMKGTQLVATIKENSKQLKETLSDQDMNRTLDTMKYVPSSDSLIFTGSRDSLKKVEDLLATLDVPAAPTSDKTIFVYKLKFASDDAVEEDLETLAKTFKNSNDLKDQNVLKVINSIQYVKETNTLILHGDRASVEYVKNLVAEYDYARPSNTKTSFLVYKPHYLAGTDIIKKLRDVGNSLKKAELTDPALLSTIKTMNYVDTTNTIIFTGTPETLAKIEDLLREIDVPAKPSLTGKKTFLLYKIKNAPGSQLAASVKEIGANLKTNRNADPDLVDALVSVHYVKETNALMLTGTPKALAEAEIMIEKFDIAGGPYPGPSGPTDFYVYKPKAMTGPELVVKLKHFREGLRATGLLNQELFSAIDTAQWVEPTQSLIFTGTRTSLDQLKSVLTEIDVTTTPILGTATGTEIQSIDNTSFLVYKLQFHKGDEIQGALRQIAKDLMLSNAPVNQNLLNSINSIQWLEVTNSLLCSGGDDDTLRRLKELIKNLDIPLKQVFIEMLVIQTSMVNALNFGLEWGAKYKYKDKLAGTMNNFIPQTTTQSNSGASLNSTDILNSAIAATNPSNSPATNNNNAVPILGPGFDLGIIGEVIRHNGDTFLSIGSLVNALQTDGETTVVMTPKIITQDGRTSTIFQGNNIPFAGSFVSNTSGGGSSTAGTIGTTNIEYRDIGTNLTITPVLGNSNIVTLDISLDQTQTATNATNNQITFNSNGLPSNINGIETSKTSMQTTVHVPDDHFLILSGMVQTSNAKQKTGIPCLGGLPLIGAAFSTDNTLLSNTNIVIFLRPHILNSMEDITRITRDQERFFREQTGTPQLEHSYNEAMEFIKSANDD
jgi:type II secretory pathway component GspD/PulD (secretin)